MLQDGIEEEVFSFAVAFASLITLITVPRPCIFASTLQNVPVEIINYRAGLKII
jgi:hypothetical protein